MLLEWIFVQFTWGLYVFPWDLRVDHSTPTRTEAGLRKLLWPLDVSRACQDHSMTFCRRSPKSIEWVS